MRRRLRWVVLIGAVLLIAAAGGVGSLYFATQHVPEFYREAVTADPVVAKKASDELITASSALAHDVQQPGEWEARFTEKQVNGWLAVDLVQNHRDSIPPGFHDPRVKIAPGDLTVACRYEGELSTVLSLGLDAYLAEENVVAVRIDHARAGALPLPLERVLDAATRVAAKLELQLEWKQEDGDPVALVTIPPPRNSEGAELAIETLELREGELLVRGRTLRKGESDAAPVAQAPVVPVASREPSQTNIDR